jgi:hypothetical protein
VPVGRARKGGSSALREPDTPRAGDRLDLFELGAKPEVRGEGVGLEETRLGSPNVGPVPAAEERSRQHGQRLRLVERPAHAPARGERVFQVGHRVLGTSEHEGERTEMMSDGTVVEAHGVQGDEPIEGKEPLV